MGPNPTSLQRWKKSEHKMTTQSTQTQAGFWQYKNSLCLRVHLYKARETAFPPLAIILYFIVILYNNKSSRSDCWQTRTTRLKINLSLIWRHQTHNPPDSKDQALI